MISALSCEVVSLESRCCFAYDDEQESNKLNLMPIAAAVVVDWYCNLAMNDPHATQITPNYPVITLITALHSVLVPELK